MNWTQWAALAGAVVTVGGSYLAARFAGKSSIQVKEIEVDAEAYTRAEELNAKAAARAELANSTAFARLQGEVDALTKSDKERGEQIRKLHEGLDKINRILKVSVNFTEKFLPWAWAGAKPPIPDIPEALYEYLDPEMMRDHRRAQEQQRAPDANPKAP